MRDFVPSRTKTRVRIAHLIDPETDEKIHKFDGLSDAQHERRERKEPDLICRGSWMITKSNS